MVILNLTFPCFDDEKHLPQINSSTPSDKSNYRAKKTIMWYAIQILQVLCELNSRAPDASKSWYSANQTEIPTNIHPPKGTLELTKQRVL